MASQYKPAIKSHEKTPKKQKQNKSMDDEKNNSNELNNNIKTKPQKLNPKANSSNNTSSNSHNTKKDHHNTSPTSTDTNSTTTHSSKSTKSTPSHNINRSFIKNSKLNIKMNASRPERPSSIPTTNKLPFDNELVLQNLIRAQIEYLFSDYHLTNDTYLLARMQDNAQHWLSIEELCHNQKIRCLTNKKERILQALKDSSYLQLSSDNERVRRPDFTLPKLKPNRDLRRTVFLYGIPQHKTEQDIRKLLSQYGHIKRIHFQPDDNNNNYDDEAPNQCVAQLIMKKKFLFPSRYSQSDRESDDTESVHSHGSHFSDRSGRYNDLYSHPIRNPNGDAQDFTHLKTCFVVFESQSQATKCVKARVRAVDGMRSIHKYDYNKVAKKYRTAQMKGEKLSFSPPPNGQYGGNVGQRNERGRSPNSMRGDCYNGRGHGRHHNQRYNRSFNPPNGTQGDRNDRRYNYRERSHSTSSTNSNGVYNSGGRYQQRYQQRNDNRGHGNYKRAQTPNFKPSGGSFYDSIGRKNRQSDDSDGGHGHGKGSRGLGRRGDRNSHDNNNDDGRGDRKGKEWKKDNKWGKDNKNKNRGTGGSRSPHRSVGNMSNNSDQKPIFHSLNSTSNKSDGSKGSNKTNNSNNNPSVQKGKEPARQAKSMSNVVKAANNIPQTQQSRSKSERKINTNVKVQSQVQPQPGPGAAQVQPQSHVQPGAVQQPGAVNTAVNTAGNAVVSSKPVLKRAATPNMNSNGSIIAPPLLHSKMFENDMNAPGNNSKLSAVPPQMQRSRTQGSIPQNRQPQSQSQRQPTAPQLYNPMTQNNNKNMNTNMNAAPNKNNNMNASNINKQAAELAAAGYQHDLIYLPNMDDLVIMDDPLLAYDSYFGLDPQTGRSTSTHHAAQQLANQSHGGRTNAHLNKQQTQPQQVQPQVQQQQQSHHYYTQQQQQQIYNQQRQQAHQTHQSQQQNYYQTQQQQQQQSRYHHAAMQQKQQQQQQQQQQYYQNTGASMTSSHSAHSGGSQTQPQQQYYQQNTGTSMTSHSGSQTQQPQQQQQQYHQQNTGTHNASRSAPYGPTTHASQQYKVQQWQLDKLQKYKAAKAQEQQQQSQQVNAQNNNKPATALSVLSSTN